MQVQQVQQEPRHAVGLHERVTGAQLPGFFARAFAETAAALGGQGAAPSGPPLAVYRAGAGEELDVLAGFPVSQQVAPGSVLETAELPGGPAVTAMHVGAYDGLGATHEALRQWLADAGLQPADQVWEEYLVGPDANPDPRAWRTRIVQPLA